MMLYLLKKINLEKVLFATALAFVFVVTVPSANVYADYFGRDEGEGYYDGHDEGGSYSSSSNVIEKGIKSSIDSAEELVDKLKDWYKGGGRDKTGASFIVNTMLGRDGEDASRSIDDDDWDEIENRLVSMDKLDWIDWDSSKSPCGESNAYRQKNNNDEAFFDMPSKRDFEKDGKSDSWIDDHCDKHDIIKFKNDGDTVYRLDRECANPMGDDVGELPEPKRWYISANSSFTVSPVVAGIGGLKAFPGQTIRWSHGLYNDGPDETTERIHSNLAITGFSNGWNGTRADGDTSDGKNPGKIRTITDYATYGIAQNDVGNTLCERVQYDPKDWEGGRNGRGNNSCVTVLYNYNLLPKISAGATIVESNTRLNIDSIPYNTVTDYRTRSKSTQWRVSQIEYGPSETVPETLKTTSTYLDNEPCVYNTTYYPNKRCNVIEGGAGSTVFSEGSNLVNGEARTSWVRGSQLPTFVNIGDYESGTKLCYLFSVQPNKDTPWGNLDSKDDRWRNSSLSCVVVGKYPKLQMLGGDAISGSKINTSTSTKTLGGVSSVFGSWTEYGAFARGAIENFGSGSAFSSHNKAVFGGLASPLVSASYSTLSFNNANTSASSGCTPGTIGCYSGALNLTDVDTSYPGGGSYGSTDFAPNDMAVVGTHVYDFGTSDITLRASELASGKSLILKTSGTITIAGNQTYANGPYTSISELPQLVLIASKIVINDDDTRGRVTRVDAWLVATRGAGVIETCNPINDTNNTTGASEYNIDKDDGLNDELTNSKCSDLLTVNGPVIARQLWLRRTAGSEAGDQSDDPAEVFNLRADAYFWSIAQSSSNNQAYSVRTVELPPRY